MRLRIVYVVSSGDMAGGQRVCLHLIERALAEDWDVRIVASNEGEFTRAMERLGVTVTLLRLERTFQLLAAIRFSRLLRQWGIHLVHTHAFVPGTILSRLAASLVGIPVISHVHIENTFSQQPLIRLAQVLADNLTARLCTRVVTVSRDTRRALVRQGIPADRIVVLYNGVPPHRRGARVDEALPEARPLLVCIGRLCQVKGQAELLEALPTVLKRHPHTHALFVGADLEMGGAYERLLRRRAEELRLTDHLTFAGFRRDIPAILERSDLVVLPSWMEGLPMVLLEAMAAGRPVVATSVGGVPEAVTDGETGWLVPPRDAGALAHRIALALDDPERLERMATAARRAWRERFRVDQMQAGVWNLYRQALELRRSAMAGGG